MPDITVHNKKVMAQKDNPSTDLLSINTQKMNALYGKVVYHIDVARSAIQRSIKRKRQSSSSRAA